MPTLIVMLRGVNVGGKTVPMERLRESIAGLGFKDVRTYIQSGNVVGSVPRVAASLTQKIEDRIGCDFGFPVSVIVRTGAEMQRILAGNPFLKERGIDVSRLHVTLLSAVPAPAGLEALRAIKAGADQFRHAGKEIYLHCPGGYGKTKLSNNAIEKALGVRATTRNWNTVGKLCAMAED